MIIHAAVDRLRRVAVSVLHKFCTRGVILMYHRIAGRDFDPWSICVTPQHLAEHLEIVQKHFCPISLAQLTAAVQTGKVPHRAVAITFDDGYANNLYNAKPSLQLHGLPATVFVASGYLERGREFWWDELEQALLRPGALPDRLCIHLDGGMQRWDLTTEIEYTEQDQRNDAGRCAWDAKPGSRLFFYYSVWQKLRPLPDNTLRDAVDRILAWAQVNPELRQSHRPLTFEEVMALERDGLVEVGAHTVTHPLLIAHPPDFQRDEIVRSKTNLEQVVGHPVTNFSYPYGEYGAETIEIVREAGFSSACTSLWDVVLRNAEPLQLPRFDVGDMDGKDFFSLLSQQFET